LSYYSVYFVIAGSSAYSGSGTTDQEAGCSSARLDTDEQYIHQVTETEALRPHFRLGKSQVEVGSDYEEGEGRASMKMVIEEEIVRHVTRIDVS